MSGGRTNNNKDSKALEKGVWFMSNIPYWDYERICYMAAGGILH